MNFKVGDLVRLKADLSGPVGTITKILGPGSICPGYVETEEWLSHASRFELVSKAADGSMPRELKVGDRIRLVNPEQLCIYSPTHAAGSVHTVESLRKDIAKIGPYSINTNQYFEDIKIWEFADEETKEEIEVTPQGGKHTAIGRAYHHFPPHAMRLMAETLHKGALKYNRPYDVMNWKNISKEDHHNHALNHIFLALENNETEDYVNAALRGIMALQMHLEEKGTA